MDHAHININRINPHPHTCGVVLPPANLRDRLFPSKKGKAWHEIADGVVVGLDLETGAKKAAIIILQPLIY